LAKLDPDVGLCLETLLKTPLAFLARIAISLIVADGQDWTGRDDAGVRERWWPDRESRTGQLEIAHRIISGRIKREIAMLQRLRELAPPLGVEAVDILPPPNSPGGEYADAGLLDPGREAALSDFLKAWVEMRDDLRRAWERPDVG
jgi:hypothetical protein